MPVFGQKEEPEPIARTTRVEGLRRLTVAVMCERASGRIATRRSVEELVWEVLPSISAVVGEWSGRRAGLR